MNISNDLVLILISGVGVVLWFFVVSLIKELKDQGLQNNRLLLQLEKDNIEFRFMMKDFDNQVREVKARVKQLEDKTHE